MNSHLPALPLRVAKAESGVTALETAIILLAFVTVAAVFAFTVLSVGTFSTERSKNAVFTDLAQVQSSLELKGGVLGLSATTGATSTVDALVFTVANAVGGQPINLDPAGGFVGMEYRDEQQIVPIPNWELRWKVRLDSDNLLEPTELAELTVPFSTTLPTQLGVNTSFVLEIKPMAGAVLTIRRTTPAYLDAVYDLQ